MKTYITADADLLHDPDAERLRGPATGLEHFFNEAGTEKIYLTTAECEEFEEENTAWPLDTDVLADALFLKLKNWLEKDLVTDAPPVGRGSAEPPPIRLVIHLDGGLVQGVVSNVPIEYIVADTDIEGCDEDDKQDLPPLMQKHCDAGKAFRYESFPSAVDPAAIEEIFPAFNATQVL